MFDRYPAVIHWGSLEVVPSSLRVYQKGRPVPLTLRQFEALMSLFAHPDRVLSREDVWRFCREQEGKGAESRDPAYRMVDVYVAHLRRRLGEDMVETVRGVGYRLGPARGSTVVPSLKGSA
ncbi:MAG: winged helix-turn-helix domain-containing protein [Firmicutes bacterium]|jgi:DNA-binding response OmpR family regulator|nr:winged helix-turn-helix domain-containing protein [Bacillota bacterium]